MTGPLPILASIPLAVIALVLASACATPAKTLPAVPAPAATASPPGAGSPRPAIDLEQFKIGFRIAVTDCAECHAIDQKSKSPAPAAPPLRDLLSGYDASDLSASLIRNAQKGKGDMPVHRLNQSAADALIAYIRVISAPGSVVTVR